MDIPAEDQDAGKKRKADPDKAFEECSPVRKTNRPDSTLEHDNLEKRCGQQREDRYLMPKMYPTVSD
ncbi:hypothetical protein GCM10008012_58080 [Rhizobium anhuiense]|nr:hypothetical protein GCM10008012_58080 [Rhizobium anhuiense]